MIELANFIAGADNITIAIVKVLHVENDQSKLSNKKIKAKDTKAVTKSVTRKKRKTEKTTRSTTKQIEHN